MQSSEVCNYECWKRTKPSASDLTCCATGPPPPLHQTLLNMFKGLSYYWKPQCFTSCFSPKNLRLQTGAGAMKNTRLRQTPGAPRQSCASLLFRPARVRNTTQQNNNRSLEGRDPSPRNRSAIVVAVWVDLYGFIAAELLHWKDHP